MPKPLHIESWPLLSYPDSGPLQGPTGRIWPTANGPATELTATVGAGNRYYNIPTLVPKQHDVRTLLNSTQPTPLQIQIALKYAQHHGLLTNGYATEPQALSAEQQRHKLLEAKFNHLNSILFGKK